MRALAEEYWAPVGVLGFGAPVVAVPAAARSTRAQASMQPAALSAGHRRALTSCPSSGRLGTRIETQTTIQAFLEGRGLKVGIINGASGQRNQETILGGWPFLNGPKPTRGSSLLPFQVPSQYRCGGD